LAGQTDWDKFKEVTVLQEQGEFDEAIEVYSKC
jgi:hypothetical protein